MVIDLRTKSQRMSDPVGSHNILRKRTMIRYAIITAFSVSMLGCAVTPGETGKVDNQLNTESAIPVILDASKQSEGRYLPDFSYAGYGFGLTPIPGASGERINVMDHGAVVNDASDDTDAIKRAISTANQVDGPVTVYFPAGRYLVSDMLEITRGNISFLGAGEGEDGSILSFTKPLSETGDGGRLDELRDYLKRFDKTVLNKKTQERKYFSEYSWTGGLIWVGPLGVRETPYLIEKDVETKVTATSASGLRGQKRLTLNSTDNLRAGQWIQVLWFNRGGKNGPLLKTMYGDEALPRVGGHHWNFPKRPIVRQRTRIEKVEGDSIVLGDPLLHDATQDTPVDIAIWQPLVNVGFEHLRLEFPDSEYLAHHLEWGFNGIHMGGVANGWVRNLTFVNAESAILTYNSASITYSDITTRGEVPAHYAVHIGSAHNVLAERIRTYNKVQHSLTVNTLSTRAVYKDSEVFQWPSLDQHGGANHQNLFDNITIHVSPEQRDGAYKADIFRSGGAKYWLPQHGLFNTIWNLNVQVNDSVPQNEAVELMTWDKNFYGPGAQFIGVHGNRPLTLGYQPLPYSELLNSPVSQVPSLYDYQLAERSRNK